MSTPLTPRRSRRYEPLRVGNKTKAALSSSQTNEWTSEPIGTRPAVQTDYLEDDEFDEKEPGEVQFHGSFTRSSKRVKVPLRTYGKTAGISAATAAETVFTIGDVVLVASETKKPSIGVITGMWQMVYPEDDTDPEGEGERMRVQIHWFMRPTQLASIRVKRDHFENEIYYSLENSAIVSPSEILVQCTVTSRKPRQSETKSAEAWEMTPSKNKATKGFVYEDEIESGEDVLYCGLAIDAQRGLYYPFQWESHREAAKAGSALGDSTSWNIHAEKKTSKGDNEESESELSSVPSTPSKKRKRIPITKSSRIDEEFHSALVEDSDSDPDATVVLERAPEEDEMIEDEVLKTPSKRKRSTAVSTPRRKRVKGLAAPTPHSKAALRSRKHQKKLPVRPPPPELGQEYYDQLMRLPPDPWLRAMHVLHVAARPDALPCRDEEYGRVLRSVEELIEEGSGGCVYISGVPGTGKTATVHAVVRELKRMAQNNETSPFTYVEINGLRIPGPHTAYNLLWEAISGHDVAADGHLTISTKEALKRLTKHFSGGASAGPGGHACVVLMDELDQLMTQKQDVVYNFFNWPTLVGSKLIVLAVANTMDLPERVMSGRVRSRLGMIRINFQPYTTAQLEQIVQTRLKNAKQGLGENAQDVIAADGVKFASMKVSSISGDARRVLDICRRAVELVQPRSKTASTKDVKEVITVLQNSPTAAYIRECSLHERILLAAVMKCIKKEGVEEVKWGDVQHQHVIYTNILTGDDDPVRKPTFGELNCVLDSLLASRAMLIEDGALAQRKPDGERRVILNLEQIEVERVLGELGGQRWKNALGVS